MNPERHVRVVLVDDFTAWRLLVRTMLEANTGCVVVGEASDGREALELLERVECDVVIMDHVMPVMTGLEAAVALRDQRPELRIVILSGTPSSELRDAFREAGAVAHFDKSELQAAIRFVCSGAA
jgi:DNA-binding NarL/FixJ family response regulator